jgi:transposase
MAEKKSENTSLRDREASYMYGTSEWQEVRRLARQGLKYQTIGRKIGMDRRTVMKLVFLPEAPRPSARRRTSLLDDYKSIISGWLAATPAMRATPIGCKLRGLGYAGGYSTAKQFVRSKKEEIFREAMVRFETLPGEQAQVDFAETRPRYIDGAVDKVTLYFFVLGFSRWKDADIAENQRRKTLMHLMERTFRELGGVVKEVLIDNLTPVTSRARTLS